MDAAISPLVLGLVVGVVLAAAAIAGLLHRRRRRTTSSYRLPQGADAALWSILEAIPDPRNHLALTRDLSGEVRLTDADRSLAAALFDASAPADPARVPADRRRTATARSAAAEDRRIRAGARSGPRPQPVAASGASRTAQPAPTARTAGAVRAARTARPNRGPAPGDEDLTLSAQLFFSGEPQLNRF